MINTTIEEIELMLLEILEVELPWTEGIAEARLKFDAEMALAEDAKCIMIPTYHEWLGINLLERDNEL